MFKVQIHDYPFGYVDKAECEDFATAEKKMFELFDGGLDENFLITDTETGEIWSYKCHKLAKDNCPECGKEVRKMDMIQTFDCHGIPFRFVCPKCYDRIMNTYGYDGQRYTEADECIEPDW